MTVHTRLPDDAWANEQVQAAGFIERQARNSFRDLCRVYGFGGARQIIADIINDEAERKTNVEHRA